MAAAGAAPPALLSAYFPTRATAVPFGQPVALLPQPAAHAWQWRRKQSLGLERRPFRRPDDATVDVRRASAASAVSSIAPSWLLDQRFLLGALSVLVLDIVRKKMGRKSGTGKTFGADFSRKCGAFWRMGRPQNIPMSILLVLAGVYGGVDGGGFWAWWPISPVTVRAEVLLCVFLTVAVTTSSCVVNDYFDFLNDTDSAESQSERPLVKGDITPKEVKKTLKWIYFILLVCICLVNSRALRVYILLNAVLTYIYTKGVKPRGPAWKNGCVALIICLAIGLGSIAVQGDAPGAFFKGLSRVWPAMVVTFFGIFAREVIMDTHDVDGDEATGIKTLAVLKGPKTAVRGAQALVLPVLATQALVPLSRGRQFFSIGNGLMLLGGAGLMMVLALRASRNGARGPELRQAIELFPLPLAIAIGHTLGA